MQYPIYFEKVIRQMQILIRTKDYFTKSIHLHFSFTYKYSHPSIALQEMHYWQNEHMPSV